MSVDEIPAGRELDALVGNAVYGFPVIWLRDIAFGDDPRWRSPYFWDQTAKRNSEYSTTASLLGGNWLRGITDGGETIEIYGRIVPAYSTHWAPAGDLLDKVVFDGGTPQLYFSSGNWWARLGGLNQAVGDPSAPAAIARAAYLVYVGVQPPRPRFARFPPRNLV